jgi:hypothetical protein
MKCVGSTNDCVRISKFSSKSVHPMHSRNSLLKSSLYSAPSRRSEQTRPMNRHNIEVEYRRDIGKETGTNNLNAFAILHAMLRLHLQYSQPATSRQDQRL